MVWRKNPRDLDDQAAQVDRLAHGALAAHDAQDAAGELGALAGRQAQVAQALAHARISELGAGRQLLQEGRAGVQCSENVVQVVRDAGAQPPDRLEPLALHDLLFDQVEAGQGEHDARADADLVAQIGQGVLDPGSVQEGAVLAAQVFDLESCRLRCGECARAGAKRRRRRP